MSEHHKPVTDAVLATFLAHITKKDEEYMAANFSRLEVMPFEAKSGSKNIKIIHNGSVWCFVDKLTGAIMKAGSWKAPEPKRYERGNVNDPESWAKWLTPYGPQYLK